MKLLKFTILSCFIFCITFGVSNGCKETQNPHKNVIPKILTISSTTSLDNSGLFNAILPDFEKKYNAKVKVIAKGTGAAIKLAEDGNVDAIFVHAKNAELKFVEEGYGKNRKEIMYNYFVLIGPANDLAKILGKGIIEALKTISESKAPFISRGDNSGTHKKEKALWTRVGDKPKPSEWYIETGKGMGDTLNMAFEKQGYCLTDKGTYLAYKDKIKGMRILVGEDEALKNIYGVIAVNPEKRVEVTGGKVSKKEAESKYELAMKFIAWLETAEVKEKIKSYKVQEETLFTPF